MEIKPPFRMRSTYPLVVETCQLLLQDLKTGDQYRDRTEHNLNDPPTQKIFMIEAWIASTASTLPGVRKRNLESIVESIDYLVRYFGIWRENLIAEKLGRGLHKHETIRLLWIGDQEPPFLRDFFTLFVPFVRDLNINNCYLTIYEDDDHLTD